MNGGRNSRREFVQTQAHGRSASKGRLGQRRTPSRRAANRDATCHGQRHYPRARVHTHTGCITPWVLAVRPGSRAVPSATGRSTAWGLHQPSRPASEVAIRALACEPQHSDTRSPQWRGPAHPGWHRFRVSSSRHRAAGRRAKEPRRVAWVMAARWRASPRSEGAAAPDGRTTTRPA